MAGAVEMTSIGRGYRSNKKWPCTACTYLNPPLESRCEMCLAHRPLHKNGLTSEEDHHASFSDNTGKGRQETKKRQVVDTNSGCSRKSPMLIDLTAVTSCKRTFDGGEVEEFYMASMESARSKKRRKGIPIVTTSEISEKSSPSTQEASSATHALITRKNYDNRNVRSDISSVRDRENESFSSSASSSLPLHWNSGVSRHDNTPSSWSFTTTQSWNQKVNNQDAIMQTNSRNLDSSTLVQHSTKEESEGNEPKVTTQTTLFGNIVKNIQQKDLSSCSTSSSSSRNYSKYKYNHLSEKHEETQQQLHSKHPPNRSNVEWEDTMKRKSLGAHCHPKGKNEEQHTRIQSLPSPSNSISLSISTQDPQKSYNEAQYQSLLSKSQQILNQTFKISNLRNLQPQAIQCALRRQSQIIVMATGGGKSLCYQLPAAVLPGITIVLSPLIALMIDQVHGLNERGINAALLSSANAEKENIHVMQRLVGRKVDEDKSQSKKKKTNKESTTTTTTTITPPVKPIKLLYCTPELVETTRFRAILTDLYKRNQLSLFAVDEAHCLSTWGHDFRPAYRKLSWLRTSFPEVPCMACTATATPKVIQDIRDNLMMKEGEVPCHLSSFNRDNISYEVRYKDVLNAFNSRGDILDLIYVVKQQHGAAAKAGVPCSGIIYVHKRNDTEKLAREIFKETGIRAAAYHAGLKDKERKETQRKWTDGSIQVAVATVAFGMGIDLPHVRYVLHWAMAKSVEGFYQESGRAGRDGKPAISILYYSKEDASKFSFLIKKAMENKINKPKGANIAHSNDVKEDSRSLAALEGMVDYCIRPGCRRKYLLHHFGEDIDDNICNNKCDFCINPSRVEKLICDAEQSEVVKHVFRQKHFNGIRGKGKSSPSKEWDGQWTGPPEGGNCDDEFGDFDETLGPGDLGITGYVCADDPSEDYGIADKNKRLGGFVKATSILKKYEMLECQEGKKNGFVKFRTRSTEPRKLDAVSKDTVVIPEHLREKFPDPLASLSKSQSNEGKSSTEGSKDIRSRLEKLKAELAQLREKKAARLANGNGEGAPSGVTGCGGFGSGNPKSNLTPPPPLSLSFRHSKKEKMKIRR